MINSKIISTGSYLPKKIYTNEDLSKMVDTTDEWILERTGIKERHIAADNEKTSDLAYKACLDAFQKNNIDPQTIDGIILATTTGDYCFPSTATILQHKLGIGSKAFAFDIQAVCSGFIFALETANNFIKSGSAKRILVVGAETLSKIINWEDRNTCILFGDGAGAVILETTAENKGILASSMHSDGQYFELLKTTSGICDKNSDVFIEMQGKEVFKLAVNKMYESILESLEKANLTTADINFLIPHQANKRILDSLAKKMDLTEENVVVTVDKHANTSAASIPLALDYAVNHNKLKENDILVLEALGGGMTWGSVVIRW